MLNKCDVIRSCISDAAIIIPMTLSKYQIIIILLIINTASFFWCFDYFSSLSPLLIKQPKPSSGHLLDLFNFRYTINSNVCLSYSPILVHSHVEHFKTRQAIRHAYPKSILDQLGFHYVFMVGRPNNSEIQLQVVNESFKFGDIVQGNFQEAYRNLTYKHVMALKWFSEYCRQSSYMVKTDDDVAVNLFKLNNIITKKYSLAGCVVKSKPIRDKHNKWYISKEEFKNNNYPTFLSGWLYIASNTSVIQLIQAITTEKYFWIDDLFVTGFLADRAKIQKTDLRSEFELDPGPIYCCVNQHQRCRFLVAPTGDNHSLLQQYPKHLMECQDQHLSCDAFRKSTIHHSCLDLWKNNITYVRRGTPKIEILT
ncbi:beta-1,3-galactosyltransferase 5-like [Adelges cooleyi]|uniref:beta-1,3-galactosyltransferase 5-like n=1 Tax=Adelges cooleyi TaxID=133065 RepID=UPI00217F247B|nr:beta-1,3-galactosyltransferase 5-like [Adelges cooleyi]